MSITATERETYDTVWSLPSYADHSPGATLVPMFQAMSADLRAGVFSPTVLDAGCGSGKGALALKAAGYDVTLCDLTPNGLISEAKGLRFAEACLWQPLKPQLPYALMGAWDFVYCCDVLEHIPPEFTMLVLRNLLDVTRLGLFLNISTEPDVFGAMAGKPLHQTVRPFVWWRDHLAELGRVVEARDLVRSGVYLVQPR